MTRLRNILWILAVVPLLGLVGCATYDPTRDERHSDLPWNEQQPWEGSIVVPGFNQ